MRIKFKSIINSGSRIKKPAGNLPIESWLFINISIKIWERANYTIFDVFIEYALMKINVSVKPSYLYY